MDSISQILPAIIVSSVIIFWAGLIVGSYSTDTMWKAAIKDIDKGINELEQELKKENNVRQNQMS